MSHYAVAVFLDPNGKNLEELLAPFDENLHVPHYIPKADIIAKVRSEIESYKNGTYAEYLKDPESYVAKHSDRPDHIEYVTKQFPMRNKSAPHSRTLRFRKSEELISFLILWIVSRHTMNTSTRHLWVSSRHEAHLQMQALTKFRL